jgi:hypothetical protein
MAIVSEENYYDVNHRIGVKVRLVARSAAGSFSPIFYVLNQKAFGCCSCWQPSLSLTLFKAVSNEQKKIHTACSQRQGR